jgi:hypothetical protein
MRRADNHDVVWVAVFSAGRSRNVWPMRQLIGEATWYVPPDQLDLYRAAGAGHVEPGGLLCPSRNAALRDAWALDLPCLQMSDDLVRITRIVPGATTGRPSSIGEVARVLLAGTARWGFPLGGCAPTANAFYGDVGRGEHFGSFVVGDLVLVRPCELFFDEQLRLKEDYDYTLQHVRRYGGAYRNDDLLPQFRHRSNPGGAVAYRTAELEQRTIAYLRRKWPGLIVSNPRRPNEILLRVPRAPGAAGSRRAGA